jgi:hypothetical protein
MKITQSQHIRDKDGAIYKTHSPSPSASPLSVEMKEEDPEMLSGTPDTQEVGPEEIFKIKTSVRVLVKNAEDSNETTSYSTPEKRGTRPGTALSPLYMPARKKQHMVSESQPTTPEASQDICQIFSPFQKFEGSLGKILTPIISQEPVFKRATVRKGGQSRKAFSSKKKISRTRRTRKRLSNLGEVKISKMS